MSIITQELFIFIEDLLGTVINCPKTTYNDLTLQQTYEEETVISKLLMKKVRHKEI